MKGGQSSLDKRKKHQVSTIWRPISTESVHISKVMKSGSTDPLMNNFNSEDSAPDDSTGGLVVRLTSEAMDNKSETEPLEGNETTPVYCKTENCSENHDNTTITDSNTVIQQAEDIRETLTVLKPNKDSEIVDKDIKHSISIQVDAPLIRFIKGKWGLTQKQIEEETGVKIILPSAKGDGSVVIEAASLENVNRASEKITNVLEQAVKSPNLDYSHFVSLPLAIHQELVEKLEGFQKSVLEEVNMIPGDMDGSSCDDSSDEKDDDSKHLKGPNTTVKLKAQNNNENVGLNMDADGTKLLKSSTSSAMGIDRSIFIKPQTFHLTVLMLKLWNKDRVALATKILKDISLKVSDALENRPVSIRLRGLACMKGSPANAHVVYAPIEEVSGDGRLLRACQVIIDAYVEAGLVLEKDARHSLKLHATLMNARHRKRKFRTRRNDSFDARDIFKRYGSEDWGEYAIREAHLSQRFVFDESGYYHCCGSIPFPGSI
ncbi:uncharacterized protein LOC110111761 isoform X2 [Dendrobium catenatum]|uniref:K Homology domain-containing protein n=4 Tax=Dendrobium catenatum TaxID=906689 RepID=A0A2I0VL35_9ASPA|nr:uncharacterized protein LOC110111761 isoform X2 [Dendrobium catenatum]XP_020699661.2 uncharacterized protein LOC110111761 isoform X2 [Dendrobium catenatum]XP_020699710.2 uncharacterized protein LOC110111761 isoform X2 [Dendrobium catenatum]PKU64126.1 hypothetical protein MA16_Dca008032 [Dendrobium catenatum]